MGVVNPLTPEVETPEGVRDELVTAAKYIPVERLGATDDCGFSPFSRDVKPKHGSPDFARDVAMQKIEARLEGRRDGLEGARRLDRDAEVGEEQRSELTRSCPRRRCRPPPRRRSSPS